MDAMHFDAYIDNLDGSAIIQMGIVSAQPKNFRNCLAKLSKFDGNIDTAEGRANLKQYLRENCRVDAKSNALVLKTPDGDVELATDSWRTGGQTQKVASALGSGMRKCLTTSVDTTVKW